MKKPPTLRVSEIAARFGLSRKTALRWKKRAVPFHDLERLAGWAAIQRKLPSGFLARVLDMRDRAGTAPATVAPHAEVVAVPTGPDPEWLEFRKLVRSEPAADRKASLSALSTAREYCSFRFARASESGDRAAQKFYADLLTKFEGTIHDCELRALKMGRDLGESYSAEDVKRLGRAIGFWLMQSADTVITQAAKELAEAAAAGPLDRESVRRVVEPLILRDRVVAPMVRASKMEAGVSLPKVFVESLRAGLEAVVEQDAPA